MKRSYVLLATAMLVFANAAFAEPAAPEHMPPGEHMMEHKRFQPVKTRQEAIARMKDNLAKLEAMSDEDWLKKHEKRKKKFEERRTKRMEHRAIEQKAPAAATPAKQ